MKIKQIKLGNQGLVVPVTGLGCMGMTGFEEGHMYGPADEQEAIATIHRSLELGPLPEMIFEDNPGRMFCSGGTTWLAP